MAIADDRSKAVELALAQIEKQFGKGSIVRLGSKEALVPIAVISTGSISFDAALGVGGIPRGRVSEVFGPESSGKTTICLQIIAEAQKAGGLAAFVDAEHALDPAYARKLGVDIDNLLVSQPDSGEQALEITEALVPAAPSTCWWSIQWPPWCPRPSWTARWATPTWACRPALCRRPCASSPEQSPNPAPR